MRMMAVVFLAAFAAAMLLLCAPVVFGDETSVLTPVPQGTTLIELSPTERAAATKMPSWTPPTKRSFPGTRKWVVDGIELNEAGKQDLFYKSAPFATRADVQRAVAKLQPLSRRALRRADSAMTKAEEALKKAVAAEEKIEKVAKATEMVGDFVVRVDSKAGRATSVAWIALIIAIIALAGIGGLILMAVKAQKQSAVLTEPTKEEPPAGEVDAPPSG